MAASSQALATEAGGRIFKPLLMISQPRRPQGSESQDGWPVQLKRMGTSSVTGLSGAHWHVPSSDYSCW